MKETFKLIQHTPIIHFKPDDIPIRATELKPAFDKFLGFNDKKDKQKYKIKINFKNKEVKDIPKRHMLYFGNMGNNKKQFVLADVEVEFFTFDSNTMDKIKENFPKFLFQYNFATRTSKGFGSFTADDEVYFPKNKKVFSFEVDVKNWENSLGYFYKLIRQGINEPHNSFYTKPLIFHYACKRGVNWEKRKIKECLDIKKITHNKARHQISSCNGNYKIVRDLLGLSTSQRWMGYNVTIIKNGEFDRFPSPIFFKPIKNGNKMTIYFWVEDFANKIFNKNFQIKINNSNCATLPVMEIDWDKFFDEFILKKDNFIKNKNHAIYKQNLSFKIKVEQ